MSESTQLEEIRKELAAIRRAVSGLHAIAFGIVIGTILVGLYRLVFL